MYGRLTPAARFWRKVDRSGECWEWRGARTHGYGFFGVACHHSIHAQRAAWILTRGPIPPGKFICHQCDNRGCVRPAHLFLGDARSNMQDMARKGRGRAPRGEDNHRAKLSWASVNAIRREYVRGRGRGHRGNGPALAARYGVDASHIWRVANGKQWQ